MNHPDGKGAALPWGWWIRSNGVVLEDGEGGRWHNVRDAFWEGHLGFPKVHFAPEQHEILVRVLAAIDARWVNGVENRIDLFGGDMVFWRYYMCWLKSVGLVEAPGRGTALESPLSEKGRSVLLMLLATREPEWVLLPIATVIAAVKNGGRTPADEDRERALRDFERDVAGLRHVFARESTGRGHLVTLTGTSTGVRMPIRRVVWSQSFPDQRVRDDLFAWLAERVDRWEDWGKMAYSDGAAALTQHLFGLIAPLLSRS